MLLIKPTVGVEPTTCWLQISCSAIEPCRHIVPNLLSDSKGIWTPVTAVKGRCLNRLTMEPWFVFFFYYFLCCCTLFSSCFPALTPRVGLEPTTTRLTAARSTDWAIEDYWRSAPSKLHIKYIYIRSSFKITSRFFPSCFLQTLTSLASFLPLVKPSTY